METLLTVAAVLAVGSLILATMLLGASVIAEAYEEDLAE